MHLFRRYPVGLLILGLIGIMGFTHNLKTDDPKPERWKAPVWADTLKSHFPTEPLTLAQGEELFMEYCSSCHGETGFGDGAAGRSLGSKPANFHDPEVTKQTDGALFWKLSNGRGNMPPFKDVFSEEQRWQLVAFLRKLNTTKTDTK
ncbi:cytochrome c [Larkinella rosea]|uniref:Cytochrome c n=2 Tax=Larkinella rosea TaxID=2025312 RepID=A0A3P1BUF8_9BACT|nr:cytochrome c [Larkinella rosea]